MAFRRTYRVWIDLRQPEGVWTVRRGLTWEEAAKLYAELWRRGFTHHGYTPE